MGSKVKKSFIFGCSTEYSSSKLILLSVPWSVTQSFRGGAEKGPEIIQRASSQMDFFSLQEKDARKQGIYLLSPPPFLTKLNWEMRQKALPIIALEEEAPGDFPLSLIEEINQACSQMTQWVYKESQRAYKAGKKIGLIGGDHSVSEGVLNYLGSVYQGDFGILHIDAHADLRKSYQGFQHSHASVMHNVINQSCPPSALVQVGVRDFSEAEYRLIKSQKNIKTFFDANMKKALFEGQTWSFLVDSILSFLPEKVYVSLDVDGLSPHIFPHTGTPVPGGLSFAEVVYLLNQLSHKHKVIGFDLVEVAYPQATGEKENALEAITSAHLLYKLCEII